MRNFTLSKKLCGIEQAMKHLSPSKYIILSLSASFLAAGCATVSMTDMESASFEASLSSKSSLERSSNSYISQAKKTGLVSSQSGFEFVTQVLLRGANTIIGGRERYKSHSEESLELRILTDSEALVASLDSLTEHARRVLASEVPITRKDVMAFESALIVTDDISRTFVHCIEAEDVSETEQVLAAVESISQSADRARVTANDLAAAYSGNDTESGS